MLSSLDRRYVLTAAFFTASVCIALVSHYVLSAWPAFEFLTDTILVLVCTIVVNVIMRRSMQRVQHATEQLGEAISNIGALINTTQSPIWSVDTNHRVVMANEAFQRVVEITSGRPFEPGIPGALPAFGEASVQRWTNDYARALRGERFTVEHSGYNPVDGGTYYGSFTFNPIMVNNEVTGVAVYGLDIAPIVEQERALRVSLERYETLTNAMNDVVWEWTREADAIHWSSALHSRYGYDVSDTDGTWWIGKVHAEDREIVSEMVQQTIAQRQPIFSMQYRFESADGTFHWVNDRAVVMYDEVGKPTRLIGVMEDIQGLKIAQQRTEEQLARLREIARFSSHEIRGPVSGILGLVQLFNTANIADPLNAEVIEKLHRAVEQLDKAIHEMVDYTRT